MIEIRHLSKIFHFNCVDPQAPRDVVVGTRGINDRNVTGLSVDSWQINTEKQTFNKLNHKVSCTYQGSSGSFFSFLYAERTEALCDSLIIKPCLPFMLLLPANLWPPPPIPVRGSTALLPRNVRN